MLRFLHLVIETAMVFAWGRLLEKVTGHFCFIIKTFFAVRSGKGEV